VGKALIVVGALIVLASGIGWGIEPVDEPHHGDHEDHVEEHDEVVEEEGEAEV
jgi:hypothetical protein